MNDNSSIRDDKPKINGDLAQPSVGESENSEAKKDKRKFTNADRVLALLLLVAGYFFKMFVLDTAYTVGAMIGIYALIICGASLVLKRGAKLRGASVVFMLLSAVFPLALLVTSSELVGMLVRGYSFVTYLAAVYYAFGNTLGAHFGDMMFYEAVKAVFVMPFCALGAWFQSLLPSGGKKTRRNVISALVGIMLAVIPTLVVISLLSYDKSFSDILSNISIDSIARVTWNLIFAAAFAILMFGDAIASSEHLGDGTMNKDGCRLASIKSKVIPSALVASFAIPLLIVYAVFFVSQWSYYVSAFTGVLPENLSYAEYAREGFFQLCTVSAINGAVLLVTEIFAERPFGKRSAVTKTVSVVLSLATLALIATAASKMALYIGMYGLTRARVYSSWFMILLAICFVILLVAQFAKLRIAMTVFVASSVMLALLAFSGIDARIAQFNVEGYISGAYSKIDIEAMKDLGDDAVPYVMKLAELDISAEIKSEIDKYASRAVLTRRKTGFFSWNIPRARADKALEGVEVIKDGEAELSLSPYNVEVKLGRGVEAEAIFFEVYVDGVLKESGGGINANEKIMHPGDFQNFGFAVTDDDVRKGAYVTFTFIDREGMELQVEDYVKLSADNKGEYKVVVERTGGSYTCRLDRIEKN